MSETTGSTHKLISCFHGQSKSKNVAARELTARYIEQTLMIISPQRALADTRDLTEKIILSMISALNDSAHETRQYGKRIVVLLAKYEHFEAICGKYLSSEDNRKGMWVSSGHHRSTDRRTDRFWFLKSPWNPVSIKFKKSNWRFGQIVN